MVWTEKTMIIKDYALKDEHDIRYYQLYHLDYGCEEPKQILIE